MPSVLQLRIVPELYLHKNRQNGVMRERQFLSFYLVFRINQPCLFPNNQYKLYPNIPQILQMFRPILNFCLRNIHTSSPSSKQLISAYNLKLKQHLQKYPKTNPYNNQSASTQTQTHKEREAQLLAINNQFKQSLKQLKEQHRIQIIRKYLVDNIHDINHTVQAPLQQPQPFYIPNQLVLKKLMNNTLQAHKKEILMIGVQNGDDQHCIFLKRILEQLKITKVVIAMPPDLPFFIKTELSFLQQWKIFLQNPEEARQTKFYLNPSPKTLKDICLQKEKINLVRNSMGRSKSYHQTLYSMMELNNKQQYQQNALLTPMLACGVNQIYLADYPVLKYREKLATQLNIDTARALFKKYLQNLEEGNPNFWAQLCLPQSLLYHRFQHIQNVIRSVSLHSDSRIAVVCPAHLCQLISQQWKRQTQKLSIYQLMNYTFNFDNKIAGPDKPKESFMYFIEKLKLLQMMGEPFIQKHFIEHDSFPYLCTHTVGGRENLNKVFILWDHYEQMYGEVKKRAVRIDAMSQEEFKQRVYHPRDTEGFTTQFD